MSARAAIPEGTARADAEPLVTVRNRTRGPYSDHELAEIVRIASQGLQFPRKVRVTFVPKRWRLFHGKRPGWTWCFTLPGEPRRRVVVQVSGSRKVRRPSSTSAMSQAQLEKSHRKGYLPKPALSGVEIPILDTAHELHHASDDRCALLPSRRRALETAADTHALQILDAIRKGGGAVAIGLG
jgi:hypothetical protein